MNTTKASKAKATRATKTVGKTSETKVEKENVTMSKKFTSATTETNSKKENIIIMNPNPPAFCNDNEKL